MIWLIALILAVNGHVHAALFLCLFALVIGGR